MGCHVTEIRSALAVARHPLAVISDRKKVPGVLAPARDRYRACSRVDAVFYELRNGLQRTALR